jgi:putative DNA primase/helicase
LIERIGDVRMVVIDPISSYLGRVDSHKNAELRAVLEPISDLAARHRVAVLAITHLNKSGSGGANDRVIGSIALVATARAAFIVCRDADDADRRLFLPSKNNIGPGGAGLGFHVVTRSTPSGIVAPAITWDNLPVNVSADQALAIPTRGGRTSARERAIDFLRRNLARGPVATRKAEATAAGISWPSVRRAKDALFERELFGQAPLSEIHGPTLGDRLRDELERLAEAILPLQDRCHRMMIRSLERLPKGARCSSPAK